MKNESQNISFWDYSLEDFNQDQKKKSKYGNTSEVLASLFETGLSLYSDINIQENFTPKYTNEGNIKTT